MTEKGAVVAEATATSATAPPAELQASMTPAARAEAVNHAPAPVQPSLGGGFRSIVRVNSVNTREPRKCAKSLGLLLWSSCWCAFGPCSSCR